MDVLKDKQFKNYINLSRYTSFPFYYHTIDNKYIYGITGNLSKNLPYVSHTVLNIDTLESLALKYYGRPDYYWVIADFNGILDPFIKLKDHYKTLKIPTLSAIKYED